MSAPDDAPAGTCAWAVGPHGGPRALVLTPALRDDAPPELLHRVVMRVLATATGTCPMCGQVAGLSVANEGAPLAITQRHDEGCPTMFDDDDRKWFQTTDERSEENDQ